MLTVMSRYTSATIPVVQNIAFITCKNARLTPLFSRTLSLSSERLQIIAATTDEIAGKKITQVLGLVEGVIVRTPTISQGFFGNLSAVVGGQNTAFTEMCKETRHEARSEMLEAALKMKADAVVGVRYASSSIGGESGHSNEVVCYGTAVTLADN